MPISLPRRLAAEGLGTAFLLIAVVGSGIMGVRLSGGNAAIALLANSLATGAALTVLITILGPVSGAHFNPAVTLIAALEREMTVKQAAAYALVQTLAAIMGVYAAHVMFALPVFQFSSKLREGPTQAFSESVATFGLVLVIAGGLRFRPAAVPALVGLYIGAAYWFTASTAFANPAVTLARMLTNSFAGISPASVPAFLAAQLLGAITAFVAARMLFARRV
jgi:glycerol uptake facilitator-like aquaporin